MPTADAFTRDSALPGYMRERASEPQRQDVKKGWDEAPSSQRMLKTIICLATAAVCGIATLWVGNPETLFADVAAELVETSAPYSQRDQSEPIQSTVSSQPALLLLSGDVLHREEDTASQDKIDEAFRAADRSQGQLTKFDELAKQYEHWAGKQDALAQAMPVQERQMAPEQGVENRPANGRDMQKQRRVRQLRDARAGNRPEKKSRNEVRREENAQQAQRTRYARAHDFPQNARRTELWHRFD